MTNAQESKMIKSKLALRFNTLYNCYEVYTSIHGSGLLFQWHQITDEVCEWYKKNFKLQVTSYIQPSLRTGGLMEVSYKGKTPE